jgi:hypothetical protein
VLKESRRELLASRPRQADSGWLFPSRSGKPHHNSSCMRKAFVDCLKEIGVERRFSSHGLRRTADDLIRRVASGEVARAITGHVTVAMTDHYAHVDTAEKRAAVTGMLRLVEGGGDQAALGGDTGPVPTTEGRLGKRRTEKAGGGAGDAPSRQLSRHIRPKTGTSGRERRLQK